MLSIWKILAQSDLKTLKYKQPKFFVFILCSSNEKCLLFSRVSLRVTLAPRVAMATRNLLWIMVLCQVLKTLIKYAKSSKMLAPLGLLLLHFKIGISPVRSDHDNIHARAHTHTRLYAHLARNYSSQLCFFVVVYHQYMLSQENITKKYSHFYIL